MATNTYVALDTRTLVSTASSVTFSSIPQTYTDLVLVMSPSTTLDGRDLRLQFNGDTGANYSTTVISAWTSATSTRSSNANYIQIGNFIGTSSTLPSTTITQIFNYSSTTTNKSSLTRHNQFQTNVDPSYTETIAQSNLWRSTSAINSITISLSSSTYAAGSTFSLYGIAATSVGAKATGGAIYSDSTYYYHVFGSTGVFTPLQSLTCDYLVVAGGGGGSAGGGGAGGLRSTVGTTGGGGSLESALSLTAQAYTITVGAGGAGGGADAGTGGNGTNGGNSSIAGSGLTTVTSTGGGGGAKDGGGATAISANNGGSGGGLGWNNLTGSVGTGTANQGFNGGGFVASGSYAGGGGGGAGAVGQTAPSGAQAGAGGAGVLITGFATATGTGVNSYYAGGGGAGIALSPGLGGAGGIGGGGTGGNGGTGGTGGTNAVANTGGGGGGRTNQGTPTAYNGGSGLVIVRYLKA